MSKFATYFKSITKIPTTETVGSNVYTSIVRISQFRQFYKLHNNCNLIFIDSRKLVEHFAEISIDLPGKTAGQYPRAGFKCVEALGRIITGGPYPLSNAIIYMHLQF